MVHLSTALSKYYKKNSKYYKGKIPIYYHDLMVSIFSISAYLENLKPATRAMHQGKSIIKIIHW